MADILDKIVAYKIQEVASAKKSRSTRQLEEEIAEAPHPRSFTQAIRSKHDAGQFALIAEIKKASPSKGLIRADFDPPSLASAYEAGGAACLSVLTDTPSFKGHPDYLRQAKAACSLPVLRKDFMVDPYQVLEARAWGADCILIIMASTDDALADELMGAARDYNLNVLVEIHNGEELDRAMKIDPIMIGINNRNLKTFETNLETTEKLAPAISEGRIIVGESGIYEHQDLQRLAQTKVRTFLVGESLMRANDVTMATRALLGLDEI